MNQLTAKIGLAAIVLALWAESVELSFIVALGVLLLKDRQDSSSIV